MPEAHARTSSPCHGCNEPRPERLWAALLIGICLALLGQTASAQKGFHTCPGSPIGGASPTPGIKRPLTTPSPLLPGTTRPTSGTNPTAWPAIAGVVGVDQSTTFSFVAPCGPISGKVRQIVVDSDRGKCVLQSAVELQPESACNVTMVELVNFRHPKKNLFGEFRDDLLPSGIAPYEVERSAGKGTDIIFRFSSGVAPGQASRLMLLSTDLGAARKTGGLILHTGDGGSSAPIPAWVPAQAQH
jgi:hypothetical protein